MATPIAGIHPVFCFTVELHPLPLLSEATILLQTDPSFRRDVKLSLSDFGAHIMTMVPTDLNGDGHPDIMVDTWDKWT
jgi:hypothetical protein